MRRTKRTHDLDSVDNYLGGDPIFKHSNLPTLLRLRQIVKDQFQQTFKEPWPWDDKECDKVIVTIAPMTREKMLEAAINAKKGL